MEIEFKTLAQLILDAAPDDAFLRYDVPRVSYWHPTYIRRVMAIRRVKRMRQICVKQTKKGLADIG